MAKCPHCNKEVKPDEIKKETVKGGILRVDKAIYVCPHCDKILGIATDA